MDIEIKPTKKNHILITLIVLTILAVIIYLASVPKPIEKKYLHIEKVKFGSVNSSIISSGQLIPKTNQIISSLTSGILSKIITEVGTEVRSDSVIMQLSNPILISEKKSALSNLKIAKAEFLSKKLMLKNQLLDQESKLIELNSNLNLMHQKLLAKEQLFKSGIISKLDFFQAQLEVKQLKAKIIVEDKRNNFFIETSQAQYEAGNAKIDELISQLELKTLQVENLNIKANISGVVQTIDVDIGNSISYGQELALVSKPYPLIALLDVNQGASKYIKINMPAKISVANEEYKGRITHIAPQVNNGLVQVKLEFVEPLPKILKPLLGISAVIELSNLKAVMWLPRPNNVVRGINYFYRIDYDTNIAIRTKVEVGKITNSQIEILTGLNIGDAVILDDTNSWKKMEVKLN